jgi:hypothetical protein
MPREKKTHCPKGHPYEGDNVAVYKTQGLTEKFAYRVCKTCSRERAKEQQARKKAGIPPGPRGRPVTDVCPQGHSKTLENLLISYTKKYRKGGEEYWYPVKYCKLCHRESRKRTMARQKEAKQNGTP